MNRAAADSWIRGPGLGDACDLALPIGTFARAFAGARLRDHLPREAHAAFDTDFRIVLRRAIARIPGASGSGRIP